KWANIRVKKTAQDAQRGKIFTRHAKLIEIAVREGGGNGDPDMNSSLQTAIDSAKADNVPNANIERAIKKGTGELKGEAMGEVLYAAMGPGGFACLIECLTDNRNRTLNNVRATVDKAGGRFADTASVQWMFERKGVLVAEAPEWSDDIELALMDLGAEDIDREGDIVSVTTDQSHWTKVRDFLKGKGLEVKESGLKWVAKDMVKVVDPAVAEKLVTFIEKIEEDDDVSEVFTNADTA
ncbi:YebC/PmpR family DNA-binding transcriptional regulator, partial [Candidatus Peregrinibacteria bacterium CG22_combo_CG10-13_8_21_14_all_49_11]